MSAIAKSTEIWKAFSAVIRVAKPIIGLRERLAVDRVLRGRSLAQGPEVEGFEREFATQLAQGLPTVALNSGTSGLHLALLAMNLRAGDEIIVPSFTFAATANAVLLAGGTPVFCDIDSNSFTLDPSKLAALIGPRTRAVMPVHLFGHPAAMNEICTLADANGIEVYEDAAQAHGASLDGNPVGTFGRFAVFSLYPTKNMTSGEGGMVVTRDVNLASRLQLLRNQGMKVRYQNETVGFNNRMSDIHAAIGRVQLKRLKGFIRARRQNADFLVRNLRNVGLPREAEGAFHVYNQFTIRVPGDRERFARALSEEHKIQSAVYYPRGCHELKPLKKYRSDSDLMETEKATAEVLAIPAHPGLSQRQLEKVAIAVNVLARAGS